MSYYLKKHWKFTVLTIVLAVVLQLVQANISLLMMQMFDALLALDSRAFLFWCIVELVVWGSYSGLEVLRNWSYNYTVRKLNNSLRQDMAATLLHKSYADYHAQDKGEYLSWLTTGVAKIEANGWDNAFAVANSTARVVAAIAALGLIYWPFVPLSLLSAAVMIILPKLYSKRVTQLGEACVQGQEAAVSGLKDLLSGYDVLRFFGKSARFSGDMDTASDRMEKPAYEQGYKKSIIDSKIGFIMMITQLLPNVYCGIKIFQGVLSPAVLTASATLIGSVANGLNNLANQRLQVLTTKPYFNRITVHADPEARLLTVSDNGIGMSEEELENNLGVIASSGTYQFRQEVGKDNEDVDIIGQFGVGFYSAFMAADRITVVTKKYGEEQAYRWESAGADGYTITPCEKAEVGTDIIMHIKEDGEEEKYSEFLQEYTLRELVKKYSDYIRWPIRMEVTKSRKKEDSPEDKPEYESYREEETLNSMVPLWQRKKSDVTREEYDKFYQEKFNDYTAPQSVVTVSAEGQVSYKALLYIPSRPPYDYYSADYERGLQLYSAGVMIMDKCQDLIGDHFGFVKGVVDSPDLSLNISRELLQHDRQLRLIANNIEKKVKGELERMLKDDREGYEKSFRNFGRQLKVGCINNYGARKELLQDLLLFYSSTEKKLVTLAEYVDRMPESQKHIYYATGENAAVMDNLPQTELLRERNMEILYLTDQADQMLVEILREYKEKSFRSAVDGDLDLDDMPEEKKADDYKEALDFMKEALGEGVDEVRISRKLKTHPVCMTSGEGMSFEMERYFNAVQPEMGMKAKRILEVNVDHPAFAAMEAARASDPEKAKKYAQVLMNQAKLIAGLPIDDPSGYTDLLCSLWS